MQVKNFARYKLFWRGRWDEKIFLKCMGVVGSRRMTEYGRRVVEKIVPNLVNDGWTIVSGFMYGIDKTAHRVCLEVGGATIAVLGWGVNSHPSDEDRELAEEIVASGGLVVSLWDKQLGTNWTFPARNKVVAEICHELVIVEAAVKSGALLTAAAAAKMGKKIWAVPGPITSLVSAGTNRLIANGLAQMWLDSGQKAQHTSRSGILRLIENEAMEAGEIARKMGEPMEKVASQLSLLVLSGQIVEQDGKFSTV